MENTGSYTLRPGYREATPEERTAFAHNVPMTRIKRMRLRAVMRFARLLRVPVDVHSKYFGGVPCRVKS